MIVAATLSPPPAVCVHSLAQARHALQYAVRLDRPVTLISAEGAAAYAGCGWWLALIAAATEEVSPYLWTDLLDCADAAGHAMAALRAGQLRLILLPSTPALAAVQGAAETIGAEILTRRPASLDLARSVAPDRLHAWLLGEAASPPRVTAARA